MKWLDKSKSEKKDRFRKLW